MSEKNLVMYAVGRASAVDGLDIYKVTTTFEGAMDVYEEKTGRRPTDVTPYSQPDGDGWLIDQSVSAQGFINRYIVEPPFEVADEA